MGDLPGILPTDAGRAERAARDYAIAVLSDRDVTASHVVRLARDTLCECEERSPWEPRGPMEAAGMAIDDAIEPAESWRLLRARVALYLRWCRRVERGDVWGWWDREDLPGPWHCWEMPRGIWPVRLAVPLWTLAPAHDPAMGPRERRNRRPAATMEAL